MSLSRKFHKRIRIGADGVARSAWGPSGNPVPSIEEADDDEPPSQPPPPPQLEEDNERAYTPDYDPYDDYDYYHGSPPLKVPRYVPNQPVDSIPDFSDDEEEAEFRAKVAATYKWMEEEGVRSAAAYLTPAAAALKRKHSRMANGTSNGNNNNNGDDLEIVSLSEESSGDGNDQDGEEAKDEGETSESAARVGMIDNMVELLETVGVTLNFLVNVQGADIDPTDLQQVRETLGKYAEDENQQQKPWHTSAEEAPDRAEAMVERLFDMPLREFLPLAYDIAEFRDELEARGINL
ncbi:uncharacterized protein F4812DRAFT_400889 [Daldinia caldariorum]|uniref:uncharacterized protein n=1 Tax=Daldinia caldariorum TaxID=326644 RepID=UPI002007AFF9|nr:uncharacterized protein F4812DRAFT_400889 [Daldinia caldariorum]KAI1467560.1 hypothetical protein F4812DRAFT_400889 [Daldinia caldariorum]